MKPGQLRQRIGLATFVMVPLAVLLAWRTGIGVPSASPRPTPVPPPAPTESVTTVTGYPVEGNRSDRRFGVVVDGSAHPDRVKDETAVALFLPALAPSPTNDPLHERRRLALLDSIPLSDSDRRVLERELAGLNERIAVRRERLDLLLAEARKTRAKALEYRVRQAGLDVQAVSVDAYRTALGNLTPSGAAALRARLHEAKASVTIFGPTPRLAR